MCVPHLLLRAPTAGALVHEVAHDLVRDLHTLRRVAHAGAAARLEVDGLFDLCIESLPKLWVFLEDPKKKEKREKILEDPSSAKATALAQRAAAYIQKKIPSGSLREL